MKAEPTETDPPKRRRRRFQFRLRTLMIGVTLLAVTCAYVVRQREIVRERQAWLAAHPQYPSGEGYFGTLPPIDRNQTPSPIRIWLGDKRQYRIVLPVTTPEADIRTASLLFPEAEIIRL
jgi:hypothetical protein